MALITTHTFAVGELVSASTMNSAVSGNIAYLANPGADLASASTIAPTNEFHKVTGTTQVNTITPAGSLLGQPLRLQFTGGLVLGVSGNIVTKTGKARVVAANEVVSFSYDSAASKFREEGQYTPTTTVATSPPSSPALGDVWVYPVDVANGVYWRFVYDPGSGSGGFDTSGTSYVWKFAGGGPVYAEVLTSETTTSTTYAALATAGPSITLARAGDYVIEHGFDSNTATGATRAFMSYDIGGTGAVDADFAVSSVPSSGVGGGSGVRKRRKTGIAASTAITAKYKAGVGANTPAFENRWMAITPIRVV